MWLSGSLSGLVPVLFQAITWTNDNFYDQSCPSKKHISISIIWIWDVSIRVFENVVCEVWDIFSEGEWVKTIFYNHHLFSYLWLSDL